MNKKGFTLIELLVVISIISLLVSILLPSLGKARELAERAACMSTLNGIGKAWVMYMDSEESIPYIIEGSSEALNFEPDGYNDQHTVMDAMEEYVAENGWQCASKVGKKYFNKYKSSYSYYTPYLCGVVSILEGSPEAAVAKVKKVGDQYASTMPIFGDRYDDSETGFGACHTGKTKNEQSGVVVFWDSHVEFGDANAIDTMAESPDFYEISEALAN